MMVSLRYSYRDRSHPYHPLSAGTLTLGETVRNSRVFQTGKIFEG
ncbi:MAG: hypothetical protein AAGA60_30815 [Cyanobacteria bacterium P01_E01_bin.42]